MTEIQYLTIDHVIEFHGEALREFGGLDGIRSPHELAAAVMQPQQSAFGEDAYPRRHPAPWTKIEGIEHAEEEERPHRCPGDSFPRYPCSSGVGAVVGLSRGQHRHGAGVLAGRAADCRTRAEGKTPRGLWRSGDRHTGGTIDAGPGTGIRRAQPLVHAELLRGVPDSERTAFRIDDSSRVA